MKGQKAANWILFIVFLLSCFNLWNEIAGFESFGPPDMHPSDLRIYHTILGWTVHNSVTVPLSFAAFAAAALGFTLWRMREEVEQVKVELQTRRTLHGNENSCPSTTD